MTMTRPYDDADAYRRPVVKRSFMPLALITLGVVVLLGNFVPDRGRGGLVVLGLGVAFMIGRATTGRYGYAVPAGILTAIGAFITIQDLQLVAGARGPGLFFILLGLGFAVTYVVGARPQAIWPLFPCTILVLLGLIPFGVGLLGPLGSFSWIVGYWPAVLVLVGAWLLFRDQLPLAARRPIATLGGLALLCYGLLAAASTVANAGTFTRTGWAPSFGTPYNDSITLDQPISAGQMLIVSNSSGSTTVHGGTSDAVHVVANRHFSVSGHAPEVRLAPSSGGLTLDASTSGDMWPFSGPSWVDYTIDVPAGVGVRTKTSSGQTEISGVTGAVQADASSGSIELTDIGGEVRASTSSGSIRGTQLAHVRNVSTSSGSVSLEGVFTEAAKIEASSGTVNVKLLPGSAVALDVRTGSGSVVPSGLSLGGGGETKRDRLTGNVGSPAPGATLSIQSSSGSVLISQ